MFRSAWSILASFMFFIPLDILVSSANDETLLETLVFMSISKIMKRIGPSTVPWGTLLNTVDNCDLAPFNELI